MVVIILSSSSSGSSSCSNSSCSNSIKKLKGNWSNPPSVRKFRLGVKLGAEFSLSRNILKVGLEYLEALCFKDLSYNLQKLNPHRGRVHYSLFKISIWQAANRGEIS